MATPATTATAGRRRTAAPRVAPELAAYKTRFNEYLVLLGLPLVDNLKEVADLKAAAATNTSTVLQLETQLQEANSRLLNVSPPSTPQRNPTAQPPAPDAGGGRRRRQESPPRSPVRSVRRRADDNPGIVRSTISAIAASPAAIAQRIVGRSAPPPPAPNFHPPAIMNQSSTVSAGGGSKTYKRWPNMSEIVIELARGCLLYTSPSPRD